MSQVSRTHWAIMPSVGASVACAAVAALCGGATTAAAQVGGGRDYAIHLRTNVPSLCVVRNLARTSPLIEKRRADGSVSVAPLMSGFMVACNVPGAIDLVRIRHASYRRFSPGPARVPTSTDARIALFDGPVIGPVEVAALAPQPVRMPRFSHVEERVETNRVGLVSLKKGRSRGVLATGGALTVMRLGGVRIEDDDVRGGDQLQMILTGRL